MKIAVGQRAIGQSVYHMGCDAFAVAENFQEDKSTGPSKTSFQDGPDEMVAAPGTKKDHLRKNVQPKCEDWIEEGKVGQVTHPLE